jgi:hypothetical protein
MAITNNKLTNLIALGQDLARRPSEVYAQIADELAEMESGKMCHKDVVQTQIPSDNFPVAGNLRHQVLHVIAQAKGEGLITGEIVQQLKEKAYKHGVDIALSKLPHTLDLMEKKHGDITVRRLPNGRKVHFGNRQNGATNFASR